MATITLVDIGSAPNDGTGDPLRDAFDTLNTNDTNLNADIASITTNALVIDLRQSQTASFNKVFSALSRLESVHFLHVSGSPSIKIGTTSGGSELRAVASVPSGGKLDTILFETFVGSTTVYITITGGTVDVEFSYRTNRFTP